MVLAMRAQGMIYVVLALLAMSIVAGLAWQGYQGNALRQEIARKRFEANERDQLEAEQRRLETAQASQAEFEQAQKERSLVSSLRAEIASMKRRADSVSRTKAASAPPQATRFSLKDSPMAVSSAAWENVGAQTPEATFETALWAAAGGDLDTLAGLFTFDSEARTKITSLFGALPAALQNELGTPERLLALLAAKDVPLGGAAKIWSQYGSPADTKIAAEIVGPEGKSKQVRLTVRLDGNHWQFVVPETAVEKYAGQLRTPTAVR